MFQSKLKEQSALLSCISTWLLLGNIFAWPFSTSASNGDLAPLKVGFVLVGSVNDMGWNAAHNQGRLYMENALKGKVETEFAENVPDSAESERVMEKMIAKGDKLIFTTSYGFLEHALHVAARHPDVTFVHYGRSNSTPISNLGTCTVSNWEPMYIAGMVAGKMTKTNKLAFVCAHPVAQVIRAINAFTLGAQTVNAKVRIQTVWTNSWSDPALEAEATKGLVEVGTDVISMYVNSPLTIVTAAEKQGVYVVGVHFDLHKEAPKSWLTGQIWNWGPLYSRIAEAVIDHKFKPSNATYTMSDGYTKLASFGKSVPPKLQLEALALSTKLDKGTIAVFKGPLKDRDGNIRVAAGRLADSKTIEDMNWFVTGVEGNLPQKK